MIAVNQLVQSANPVLVVVVVGDSVVIVEANNGSSSIVSCMFINFGHNK